METGRDLIAYWEDTDLEQDTDQQGVVVLGAPLGHAHFITRILQAKTKEHSVLFRRILAVQDLQCAWLLLLFCAATRANYFLRVVQPDWSEPFAAAHDENVELYPGVAGHRRDCEGAAVVESPSSTWGGWGCGAPFGPRLPRIGTAGQIHSHEFEKGIPALQTLSGSPCFEADFQKAAISRLQQPAGNVLWMLDSMPQSGGTLPESRDQADPQRTGTPQNHVSGGNVLASADVERTFLQGVVWSELSPVDRALLRSQCGPFAGIQFTCSPVVVESSVEPQIFWVLLLRRLWCPLPLSAHFCRCGRPLDVSLWAGRGVGTSRVPAGECSSSRLPRGRGEGLSQRPRG